MNENKLFKQVSDRQMPDLEAIRKACIEQQPQETKSKIIRFSAPRIISVAAVCAVLALGMVAVFANPGGVFTMPQTEVTVTETKVTKVSDTSKSKNEKKPSPNGNSYNPISAAKPATEEKSIEEKLIKLLKKSDIMVDTLSVLGKLEGFNICYATDYRTEDYSCDYIIGDYVFSSDTQCAPNGLGIYVVDKDQCFFLDEAYSEDVFDDFDEVAAIIENSEAGIKVRKDDSDAEAIQEYFDMDTVFVANVGEVDGGRLLYKTDEDYTGESGEVLFGDYEFFYSDAQESYALGFYFIENGAVYNLTEAVEQEKITDISEVVELINKFKTKTAVKVFITEKEELTTEPETEESVDDVEE